MDDNWPEVMGAQIRRQMQAEYEFECKKKALSERDDAVRNAALEEAARVFDKQIETYDFLIARDMADEEMTDRRENYKEAVERMEHAIRALKSASTAKAETSAESGSCPSAPR